MTSKADHTWRCFTGKQTSAHQHQVWNCGKWKPRERQGEASSHLTPRTTHGTEAPPGKDSGGPVRRRGGSGLAAAPAAAPGAAASAGVSVFPIIAGPGVRRRTADLLQVCCFLSHQQAVLEPGKTSSSNRIQGQIHRENGRTGRWPPKLCGVVHPPVLEAAVH